VTFEPASPGAPHGMLVLTAQLLDVASVGEVTLEASSEEALLLRTGADAACTPPLLRVALPALCEPDGAAARWDKRARRLTVRLPRAPPTA
jgi:hypothetical protein